MPPHVCPPSSPLHFFTSNGPNRARFYVKRANIPKYWTFSAIWARGGSVHRVNRGARHHAHYKEGPTIQAPQMNLPATSYGVTGATTAVTAAMVDSLSRSTHVSAHYTHGRHVCAQCGRGSISLGAIALTDRACSRRPTPLRWSTSTAVAVVVDHRNGGFEGANCQ